MTPEIEKELRGKVREHLGFIDASCAGFDQGRQSEALRVAVSLRVLSCAVNATEWWPRFRCRS